MTRTKAELVREEDFARTVTDLATRMGYQYMHVRTTIGKDGKHTTSTSITGWPDYIFYGHGRLFFAELKAQTGELSASQRKVISDLRAAGATVYVWRPAHFYTFVVPVFTAHRPTKTMTAYDDDQRRQRHG